MLDTIFLLCAVTGGTFLICQFALLLIGIGGHEFLHSDAGHDGSDNAQTSHDGTDSTQAHHHAHSFPGAWLLAMFSFRTMSTAVTFFGLSGLAASGAGLSTSTQLLIAVGVGWMSMVAVYKLFVFVRQLSRDETVKIEYVIGHPATVYLPIPASNAGMGKVFVTAQNRQMEFPASTNETRDLQSGEQVHVVSVNGMTLVVAPNLTP